MHKGKSNRTLIASASAAQRAASLGRSCKIVRPRNALPRAEITLEEEPEAAGNIARAIEHAFAGQGYRNVRKLSYLALEGRTACHAKMEIEIEGDHAYALKLMVENGQLFSKLQIHPADKRAAEKQQLEDLIVETRTELLGLKAEQLCEVAFYLRGADARGLVLAFTRVALTLRATITEAEAAVTTVAAQREADDDAVSLSQEFTMTGVIAVRKDRVKAAIQAIKEMRPTLFAHAEAWQALRGKVSRCG